MSLEIWSDLIQKITSTHHCQMVFLKEYAFSQKNLGYLSLTNCFIYLISIIAVFHDWSYQFIIGQASSILNFW